MGLINKDWYDLFSACEVWRVSFCFNNFLRTYCPKGLDMNETKSHSVDVQLTDYNTGIYSFREVRGLF